MSPVREKSPLATEVVPEGTTFSNGMTLSIVILSYRSPALLRLCLKSLATALAGTPLSYEVIVVDNATTPETRHVVEHEFQASFPALKLIPLKENGGYTRGVNTGLKAAEGEYILSLNQDIVATKDQIESLLAFAQKHPEAGLVGPELLNFNGTHQDSYFRFYTPLTVLYRRIPFLPLARRELDQFVMRGSDHRSEQHPDWLSGAAFLVSRTALERVGYLDERFFHYFSDVDWARRFWDNGLQIVYYPGAALYHYLGRSSKSGFFLIDMLTNRTAWWHISDGLKYFLKYGFFRSRPAHYSHAIAS